jgi:hypothetical protein
MAAESHTPQISAEHRTAFIPVLKSDIVPTLAEQGLTRDQSGDFHTLCAFLGAYFHHDFYDEDRAEGRYAWFRRPDRRAARPKSGSRLRQLCAPSVMAQTADFEG